MSKIRLIALVALAWSVWSCQDQPSPNNVIVLEPVLIVAGVAEDR